MSPKKKTALRTQRRLAIVVTTATMAAAFISIFASLGTQVAVISILAVGSFAVILTILTIRAGKAVPGSVGAGGSSSASKAAGLGLGIVAIITGLAVAFYVHGRPDSLGLDDAVTAG